MRASVLLIALTVAFGQNASFLCAVWCHLASPPACDHQDETTTIPSVTASDACAEVTAPASLLAETVRPGARSHVQLATLAVPVHRLTPPVRRGFGEEPGHLEPREARPLVLSLRI